jgi:Protein of unknown function (DUF2798)
MALPARYAPICFAGIMSCLMALLMSGLLTAINVGLNAAFVFRWFKGFAIAWPIAFILVLVLAPLVRRWVAVLCRDNAL